jgi:two-component system, NtrC family, sensor kinase
MKKIFRLFLFSSLLFSKTIAQNNLPSAYEIKADTENLVTIPDSCWQFVQDEKGKWTLADVTNSYLKDKFRYADSLFKSTDQANKIFWVRYQLKNRMAHEAKITITMRSAIFLDIYSKDSTGKWIHVTTGINVPWSKRDGFKRARGLPFIIPPGQELLIYERFQAYTSDITNQLHFTDAFIKERYIDDESNYFNGINNAFLFGVLLFACLFNIFYYYVIREKVYLYYALFIFFYQLSDFFTDLQNIFFREHTNLTRFGGDLIDMLASFFLIQFVRYFLQTFKYLPKWDIVLKTINILQAAAMIFLVCIHSYVTGALFDNLFDFTDVVTTVIYLLVFLTFLFLVRTADRSKRLMITAALPALFFWTIGIFIRVVFGILNEKTGLPVPGFVSWVFRNFSVIQPVCMCWLVLIFSVVLFQRFVQLRKENAQQALDKERLAKEKEIERGQLIEQQKIELEKTVEERTAELKKSLQDLKSTQSQLIQSEKMASLGELTAGIAHEIQNPLNFVNNFSEVNTELIAEIKEEIDKGNIEEVRAIANDIADNEQKINHHGKRADAIVKGMLQHSRSSTGVIEPTDINVLADEYLRLAYHGLRAKDKDFSATMNTDFDTNIGKINIIPQDIGRVLLNLYNNAFYAVAEKKKQQPENYEPKVSVSSKKMSDKVILTVKDNGKGISQKVLDKIFQPFFTTKPTGEGTGLGLSLSYDIVKAHGGEIKVETKEGQGSEFIILLPFV